MAQPILRTSIDRASIEINRLNNYVALATNLEAKHQYFVAEVVMLRLFSILEGTLSEFSFKLGCGATYTNGSRPRLVSGPYKSMQAVQSAMKSVGRTKAIELKWTKANFVENSVKHVLDTNDSFMRNVNAHGMLINEMRIIRNHIAHRNHSTSSQYRQLLNQKFGANPKLTVGAYLVSTRRNPRNMINSYLLSTPILLRTFIQGY